MPANLRNTALEPICKTPFITLSEYRRRLLKLQNEIPIALEKIDHGTFGEYEICGQEIAAGIRARKPTSLCGYCDRMHLR